MSLYRRNMDEELRAAQRASETGDPRAFAAYVRFRQRRGEHVAPFEAQAVESDPRERLRFLNEAKTTLPYPSQIEDEYRVKAAEINQRAMVVLRNLHARIRRSRRTRFTELQQWAIEVAGQDAVSEALARFEEERRVAHAEADRINDENNARRKEIDVLLHQIAWVAAPRHGSVVEEFMFSRTDTHSGVGLGASQYAKSGADGYVLFLTSQGFEARMENEPGTLHERPWDPSQWNRSYRTGDGWRVFVLGIDSPLDGQILRLRYDGWHYPEHYFGHDALYGPNPTVSVHERRAWFRESYDMLSLNMTVERMKQIVAERGPLRPSWLLA